VLASLTFPLLIFTQFLKSIFIYEKNSNGFNYLTIKLSYTFDAILWKNEPFFQLVGFCSSVWIKRQHSQGHDLLHFFKKFKCCSCVSTFDGPWTGVRLALLFILLMCFLFCFFVSPCLVLSVASWGNVSLVVSSSLWKRRFLYSYERYIYIYIYFWTSNLMS